MIVHSSVARCSTKNLGTTIRLVHRVTHVGTGEEEQRLCQKYAQQRYFNLCLTLLPRKTDIYPRSIGYVYHLSTLIKPMLPC